MSMLLSTRRALLSGGGVPAWVLPGFAGGVDAYFSKGLYYGMNAPPAGLTTSRASTGYANDAAGNWYSFGNNVPRITNLGLKVEEQRTNVIQNTTMQGAVVGAARTVVNITSLSRNASTTAVADAAGTNVAVGDTVTITGASVAAYNGTFAVTAAVGGVSFSYNTGGSATDSASGASYTAVSPGTVPTNWSIGGLPTGVSYTVSNITTINNVNVISITFAGTNYSGSGAFPVINMVNNNIAASQGQIWTPSTFIITSGSAQLNWGMRVGEYNSGGSFLAQSGLLGVNQFPTFQRISGQYTTVSATIAYVSTYLSAQQLANGLAFSQVVTVGWPQLELGASVTTPIPTTNAAVTRNADVITLAVPPNFGAAYTLFATGTPDASTTYGSVQGMLAVSSGNTNNRGEIDRFNGNANSRFIMNSGGSLIDSVASGTVLPQATIGKIAFAINSGSQRGCTNGGSVTNVGTSASVPISLSEIDIGFQPGGGSQYNGFLSRIAFSPVMLSDAGLIAITNLSQFN